MSIAVLGEALIDLIVREDGAYQPHLGGSPYNVAIGLARQGMDVSYLSPFSDDVFGDQLRESLAAESVSLPSQVRSKWPTSLAMVTLAETGQASYRLYREGIADKDISADDIIAHLPKNLTVFHTGSLAITPSQLPKIKAVFGCLRERGVLISIDINIRLRASLDPQSYLSGVRSLLPLADILKASDEDIDDLGIVSDTMDAAEIVYSEMGGGILLLTKGTGGAAYFNDDDRVDVAGYPVAAIADTVGAGDTFQGAFLAFLQRTGKLRGSLDNITTKEFEMAVDYACAAAAINVARAGCNPPNHEEVEAFMVAAQR